MKAVFRDLLSLIFIILIVSKYAFRNKTLKSVGLGFKVAHAAAMIFVGSICWDSLISAGWILRHPHSWLEYLENEQRFYPLWVDVSMQTLESIAGLVGLICAYFVLRGYRGVRHVFLAILPVVFIFFAYRGVRVGLRHYGEMNSSVLVVAFIAAIPFAAMFVFYTRPSVIAAIFDQDGNGVVQKRVGAE